MGLLRATLGFLVAVGVAPVRSTYTGTVEIPGAPLQVVVTLEQRADGSRGGAIDIPAQNARALPLEAVVQKGADWSFAIQGPPGAPRFDGKADGKLLKGRFSQGGQTFPFSLMLREPGVEAAAKLRDLEGLAQKALQEWEVPGLALGVIKDGELAFRGNYGLRNVDKKLPVTSRTLFAIGSTTKAFTSALLGLLVEEGKLKWDAPVRTYIPEFSLTDSYAAEHLTLADMLNHISGLPGHDLVWYGNTQPSREEILKRLAHLPLSRGFLREWQYNNMMYMAAGHVAERVTGKSWETLVRERLLAPLQMARSNFSVKDSQKDADFALPYDERAKKISAIPFREITTAGPAGSINSSVEDMSHWVIMHLSGGRYDGNVIIPPAALSMLHKPRALVAQENPDPTAPLTAYASGWGVTVYQGHLMLQHSGGIDGFTAQVALFPHDGLGVVAFTNRQSPLSSVMVKMVADRMLDLPARDWLGERLAKVRLARTEGESGMENAAKVRKSDTQPSHPLEEMAGSYADAGYGTLEITHVAGALHVRLNGMDLPLEHWHYDTFSVQKNSTEPEFEGLRFRFLTDDDGVITSVLANMEPSVPEIAFRRQADTRLMDPRFLKALAGTYVLSSGGDPMTVVLRGKTLFMHVPKQPAYELIPDVGNRFMLKGLTGFRVEFEVVQGQPSGKARMFQPNGVFDLRRQTP